MKRDLQNQIQLTKTLQHEKLNLSSKVALVEEEMSLTIESYRSVLEAGEGASEADSFLDFTDGKHSVIRPVNNNNFRSTANTTELK